MATIAVLKQLDGEHLVENLQDAAAQLGEADGEVVLDFASVRRVPPAALQALDNLAGKSEEKKTRVVLRRVNVDVYKVLKLARLSSRFVFVE